MLLNVDFEPVGVVSFRDARPFQAGTTSVARSLSFPPPPGAFWAAARDVLVQEHQGGKFVARAFSLWQQGEHYVPWPLDLLYEPPAEGRSASWDTLVPRRTTDHIVLCRRAAGAPVLTSQRGRKGKILEGGFLSAPQFRSYLSGTLSGLAAGGDPGREAAQFYKPDMRTGAKLDGRRVATGHLYSQRVLALDRKSHTCFRLMVEMPAFVAGTPIDERLVRLGGESRIAHLQVSEAEGLVTDDELRSQVMRSILENTSDGVARLKLYMLTPAVYSANLNLLGRAPHTPAWRPWWLREQWMNSSAIWPRAPYWCQGRPAPFDLRLVEAVNGKPYPLGFWDSKLDRGRPAEPTSDEQSASEETGERDGPGGPRPLYRCVPPGAVYFVEVRPSDGSTLPHALATCFEYLWGRSLLVRKTGALTFFGQMGFGVTFPGVWDHACE